MKKAPRGALSSSVLVREGSPYRDAITRFKIVVIEQLTHSAFVDVAQFVRMLTVDRQRDFVSHHVGLP